VGVYDWAGVSVRVGEGVGLSVGVADRVGVWLGVADGVADRVAVGVGVDVGVAVGGVGLLPAPVTVMLASTDAGQMASPPLAEPFA